METRTQAAWIAAVLATLAGMIPDAVAAGPLDSSGLERYATGSIVYVDNDALSIGDHDKDYTGGIAVTLAGRRAAQWWISADPLLGLFDGLIGLRGRAGTTTLHSAQFGGIAFTPADVDVPMPIAGDRPYASLVYWSNGRMYLRDDETSVYHTSVSLGALGLDLMPDVQRAVHGVLGASKPRGWDHQISDGGEPTIRYTVSRQDLFAADRTPEWGQHDFKSTVGLSLGYTTEANAALSWRWGRLNTPWWSFPPERVNYISEPVPVVGSAPGAARELFVWAGVKLKMPVYNAFLQGQFRDSDLSYDHGDLQPLVGEAWLGATVQVAAHTRLSWVVRYQTSELRDGPGDRELLWGSLFLTQDL